MQRIVFVLANLAGLFVVAAFVAGYFIAAAFGVFVCLWLSLNAIFLALIRNRQGS